MHSELLIIFYKNPVLGKVKTRLAATLGDAKALEIYRHLASHTMAVCSLSNVDRMVFYSDSIVSNDIWEHANFQKELQHGDNLGERMSNAFLDSFKKGYKHICIIGTDCFELTQTIVEQAFQALKKKDVVIGLAKDGGYYLLGMNAFHSIFFQQKNWSTHTVGHDTVKNLLTENLSYSILPLLSDVDTEKDLPKELL